MITYSEALAAVVVFGPTVFYVGFLVGQRVLMGMLQRHADGGKTLSEALEYERKGLAGDWK
jgi:hypothetical protein